jgi:ribosomal protein L37AE/L43A
MRSQERARVAGVTPVAEVPSECPTCGSRELKTTSKAITAETYWRCCACGEVWNVGRLRAAARYIGYQPFHR